MGLDRDAFTLPVWDIPPGWRLGELGNRYWLSGIDPTIQWSVTLISDGEHEPVKDHGPSPSAALSAAVQSIHVAVR